LELFIGLVFDTHSVHYQKIENFRKRYDSKFFQIPLVQMSILPPFEIELKNRNDQKKFKSDLSDLIEDHLLGLNEVSQIEFNGLHFSMSNKGIIGLNAKTSPDFEHLKESLKEFLKIEGAKFNKSKIDTKILMPIGRFDYFDQFESALDYAKLEFSSPFVLNAVRFVLFEKNLFNWNLSESLYDFNQHQNHLFVNQLWAT
jgi:hypothetical protein